MKEFDPILFIAGSLVYEVVEILFLLRTPDISRQCLLIKKLARRLV